jgi:oxaloacetate decarboxylase (Na+ extruding) subunit alpha
MSDVSFVDTTLRDGSQSLWALNMRTNDMRPVLPLIDRAGFDSAEFWIPAIQIRKMAKDLGENPWAWVDASAAAARTPLRYHGGIEAGFGDNPASISRLMIGIALAHGITTTRISDPWNNFERLGAQVDELAAMGMRSVVNVIYTVSPRHDDDHFVERTGAAARMRPYRICFKDVGGLLTPEVADRLFPRLVAAAGDVPLEFHAHCNNGMAPLNCLLAADHGIRYLHGAIDPLSNGSSNPSIFSLVRNLAARGHTPQLDLEPLRAVAEHLGAVADRDGHPRGRQAEFDATLYTHQVPGGMVSNLRHQLGRMRMLDRLPETFTEAARVRADYGYPIMVTPLSQFVGSQAAINVITGTRYGTVTDETIRYALGWFGDEAAKLMDPDVRHRILDRPRAEQIAAQPVPNPSLDELRAKHGRDLTDEQLILAVCAGTTGAGLTVPDPAEARLLQETGPVAALVSGLLANTDYRHIEIRKNSLRVVLDAEG